MFAVSCVWTWVGVGKGGGGVCVTQRDTERERERERARARMFIGLNVAGTHPSRGLTAVSELSSNMEAST